MTQRWVPPPGSGDGVWVVGIWSLGKESRGLRMDGRTQVAFYIFLHFNDNRIYKQNSAQILSVHLSDFTQQIQLFKPTLGKF